MCFTYIYSFCATIIVLQLQIIQHCYYCYYIVFCLLHFVFKSMTFYRFTHSIKIQIKLFDQLLVRDIVLCAEKEPDFTFSWLSIIYIKLANCQLFIVLLHCGLFGSQFTSIWTISSSSSTIFCMYTNIICMFNGSKP